MNQTILFSPIGGTDPISEYNFHDGALLHICRYYQPDKVYIYMSKEILDKHKKDNRYLYCLEKLSERNGKKINYEIFKRDNLTEVHNFDWFYSDFKQCISDILKTMDDTDTLLINLSSGTPAMKSGLLILYTLSEFKAKLIQVSTPDKCMNTHQHNKEVSFEEIWELNPDNEDGAINRCQEVTCPTLNNLTKINLIKNSIRSYDYSAAYNTALTLSVQNKNEIVEILKASYLRNLLDYEQSKEIFKKYFVGATFLPHKKNEYVKLFEYAINLIIKAKRTEYADFIRAISPLIVDIFEAIIKKQTGIDIRLYLRTKYNNQSDWIDNLESKNPDLFEILNKGYNYNFKGGFLKSDHLIKIINAKIQDVHIIEDCENLRNVEASIRNLAAHQIVCITNKSIKEQTGLTCENICSIIKKMFDYLDINVDKNSWLSYDEMNEAIIDKLENLSITDS